MHVGINGQYSSIQYPRWLLATVGLTLFLLGAGATVGLNFATRESRYDTRIGGVEHGVTVLAARVDRIGARVDSLVAFRVGDTRILDALGRLRCLDGTPRRLTEAASLPCASLLQPRGAGQ